MNCLDCPYMDTCDGNDCEYDEFYDSLIYPED